MQLGRLPWYCLPELSMVALLCTGTGDWARADALNNTAMIDSVCLISFASGKDLQRGEATLNT
ncbi:hypothetical protein D3C79_772540 [compost metagenome]